jgi:hypothetical protein
LVRKTIFKIYRCFFYILFFRGNHIFEHVVGPNGLLSNRTRVLVTHGVSYLPRTDLIVVLSSGTISEVGTYDQLLENNGAFAEFLHTYQLDEVQESIKQEPGKEFLRSLRNIDSAEKDNNLECLNDVFLHVFSV